MNLKKIIIPFFCVLVIGCQDDDDSDFDHAAQYETEKIEIDTYLASHYYNDENDQFEDLIDGETALIDDVNLTPVEATLQNINYTMYTYETVVGTGDSPDDNDTINIAYEVTSLENELYEEFNENDGFMDLTNLITAWQVGLPNFKEGESNEDVTTLARVYTNSGEGFMVVPSGLAYQNIGSNDISANETILFKIVLKTVVDVEE